MTNQPQPNIGPLNASLDSIADLQRYCHEAMATTFEIFIPHKDPDYAQQAAWAAFDELDRLEAELSHFVENSDISQINNLTQNQSLQIGLAAFECLQLSKQLQTETHGAFDINVGFLMDCWYNQDRTNPTPSEKQIDFADKDTGLEILELDPTEHKVRLLTESISIDLGGIGKGFALDKMAMLLSDWNIETALIHSGHSSVLALNTPARLPGWPLTLSHPANRKQILTRLALHSRAVAGSGLEKGQHIIDPRSAKPVEGKLAAWACAPDATTADALSTAFMVMSPGQIEQYCLDHSDVLAMVVLADQGGKKKQSQILKFGSWDDLGTVK